MCRALTAAAYLPFADEIARYASSRSAAALALTLALALALALTAFAFAIRQ